MDRLIDWFTKAFNVGITMFIVLSLVIAAGLFAVWTILWAMLSGVSN